MDSSDLSQPIANARFRIEAVDGSWGPEEYTTLEDGTIDLSKLPADTAYIVTELECPGYIVDDAQRIIHLDGGEQAQFVFTNSKMPSLHLYKESADGTPLGGVTYRLAKIEDGGHSYCTPVSLADAQPGDLAFYPDDSHVGIVVGRREDGKLLICHCSSGQNNVVVTEFGQVE